MSGNLSNSVNKRSIKVFVTSFGRKFQNLLQLSELSDFCNCCWSQCCIQNFTFYFIINRPKCICTHICSRNRWFRQTILIRNSDFEIFYNEKTFFDDLLNECNRDEIIPLSSHSYNNVWMRLKTGSFRLRIPIINIWFHLLR